MGACVAHEDHQLERWDTVITCIDVAALVSAHTRGQLTGDLQTAGPALMQCEQPTAYLCRSPRHEAGCVHASLSAEY